MGERRGCPHRLPIVIHGNIVIRQTLAKLDFEVSYSLKNEVFQVEITV